MEIFVPESVCIEDGARQLKEGVKIYENYYIEDSLSNGSTMRFFKNRTEVDKSMPDGRRITDQKPVRSQLTACTQIIIH